MVDIIGGAQLGVINNRSLEFSLGPNGGQNQQNISVNAVTGNISLQHADQVLIGRGPDAAISRIYNSQGLFDDDNRDNFRFNINRRLIDPVGLVNTAGSRITRVAQDGGHTLYTFNSVLGVYQSTDGRLAHDTLTYNASKNQWTWTEGSSRLTEIYESDGSATAWRLIELSDAEGRALRFSYHANGFVNRILDVSGQQTLIDYSGVQATRIRTISEGATQTTTHYQYDSLNRLKEVTVDLSPADNSITDGNVYTTSYSYDKSSHRITSIQQSDGTIVTFSYVDVLDVFRVESVTYGAGVDAQQIFFRYDPKEQQTDIIRVANIGAPLPVGPTTSIAYDSENRITATTAAADRYGVRHTTRYFYDADDNLIRTQDPDGHETTYRYDARGNLIETRSPDGRVTTQSYTTDNQLESVTRYRDRAGWVGGMPSDDQTIYNFYDTANRVRFVLNAEGGLVETRYSDFADGTRQVSKITYSEKYVGANNTAAIESWISSRADLSKTQRVDLFLDVRGQVERSVRYARVDSMGNGVADSEVATTHYIYDQYGRLLQSVDPRGVATAPPGDFVTSYVYDGMGRLLSTTNAEGFQAHTLYSRATVTSTQANQLQTQTVTSSAGDVISETKIDARDGAALAQTRYIRDQLGNLRATIAPSGSITHQLYDRRGRLIASINDLGVLTELFYDSGNRLIRSHSYTNTISRVELENLARTALTDTYADWGGVSVLNRIRPAADIDRDRVTHSVYDAGGQLVYAIDAEGYVTESRYDGMGRVIETIRHDVALAPRQREGTVWQTISGVAQALSFNPELPPGPGVSSEFYYRRAGSDESLRSLPVVLHTTSTMGLYGGVEQIVNANPALDQREPSITTLSNGMQVVVWKSSWQDGSHGGVYGQLYTAEGKRLGGEFLVATATLNDQSMPAVASAGDNFVVSWASSEEDGSGRGIYAQIFDQGGLKKGTAFLVNSTVSGHQTSPSITGFSDGKFFISWQSPQDGSGSAIVGQRFHANGGRLGYEFVVNSHTLSTQSNPDVITLEDDSFVVVWQSFDSGSYDIRAQRFSVLGSPVGPEVMVYNGVGHQYSPKAVSLADGGYMVTWQSSLGDGSSYAVFARKFDVAGNPVSAAFLVNEVTSGSQIEPAISRLTDGTIIISWRSNAGGYEGYDIVGQRFNERGERIGSEFHIADDASRNQLHPAIAPLLGGGFAAIWASNSSGGVENDVVYRAFQPSALGATRYQVELPVSLSNDFYEFFLVSNDAVFGQRSTIRGEFTRDHAANFVQKTQIEIAPEFIATADWGDGSDIAAWLASNSTAESRRSTTLYDDAGRTVGRINAEGYLTEYVYNAAGLRTQEIQYGSRANAFDWSGDLIDAALLASADIDRLRPITSDQDARTYFLYNSKAQVVRTLRVAGDIGFDSPNREVHIVETSYGLNGKADNQLTYSTALYARGAADAARFDALITALKEADGHISAIDAAIITPTQTAAEQAQNRTQSYSYDALNQVISQIDNQGTVTRNQYDEVGRLTQSTVAEGTTEARTSRNTYDLLGRTLSETSPLAAELAVNRTHQYDEAGRVIQSTDEQGNSVYFYYNRMGQLIYRIDPEGYVVKSEYNSFGEQVATVFIASRLSGDLSTLTGGEVTAALTSRITTSIADLRTEARYNQRGLLEASYNASAVKHRSGPSERNEYNAFGELTQLAKATHINNGEAQYRYEFHRYDRRGLVEQSSVGPSPSPDWRNTNKWETTRYDAFGRVTEYIDPLGKSTSNVYDGFGRLIEARDTYGHRQAFSYDPFSQVLSSTDASGATTRYSYDQNNREVTVTTAEGISTTTRYNRHGQEVEVVDGKGNVAASYQYDKNGNLTQSSDAMGNRVTNRYNAVGQVYETEDANGNITQYFYDARNNLLRQVVDPSGLNIETQYRYDAFSKAIRVTDPAGNIVETHYDADGRPQRIVVDPDGLALFTQFDYDLEGKKVRTIQGSIVNGFEQVDRDTEAHYDAFGRQISTVIDPLGLSITESISFNKNDKPVSRTNANGDTSYQVYNAAGEHKYSLTPVDLAADGSIRYRVSENRYDVNGRITSTVQYANLLALSEASHSILNSDYLVSRRLGRIRSGDDRTNYKTYDQDGRLVFSMNAMRELVENRYDNNGNITATIYYANAIDVSHHDFSEDGLRAYLAAAGASSDDRALGFVYDVNNRLTHRIDALGFVTQYEYDANGRIVNTTVFANPIDLATQTVANVVADASNDRTVRTVYDAAGRDRYKIDALGYITENQYDGAGKVTRSTRYASPVTLAGNPTEAHVLGVLVSNPSDQTIRNYYDGAGRLLYSIDAMSYLTESRYDALGQVLKTVRYYMPYLSGRDTLSDLSAHGSHLLDRVEESEYDKAGRRIELFDGHKGFAETNSEKFTYDALGNLTRHINKNGHITLHTYDKLGRTIRSIKQQDIFAGFWFSPQGYVEEFSYDAFGNVLEHTQYMNSVPLYGGFFPYLYQYTAETAPRPTRDNDLVTGDRVTRHRYNKLDQRVETILPGLVEGRQVRNVYEHNSFGEQIRVTEAAGLIEQRVSESIYDRRGQLIETRAAVGEPEEARTQFSYNAFGQLTQKVDARGVALAETNQAWAQQWREAHGYSRLHSGLSLDDKAALKLLYTIGYQYDQQGQKVQQTSRHWGNSLRIGIYPSNLPETTIQTFYDGFGNMIRSINPNGADKYYYYDSNNRLRYQIDEERYVTQFTYDAMGQMSEKRVVAQKLELTDYSAVSHDEIVALLTLDPLKDQRSAFTYDAQGNVTEIWYAHYDVDGRAQHYTESFTYDAMGKRLSHTNLNGHTTEFEYDALGRLLKEILPEVSVVTAVNSSSTAKTTIRIENKYEYDALGNLVAKIEADNLPGQRRVTRYVTDKLGKERETIVEDAIYFSRSYGGDLTADQRTQRKYDAVGNLVEEINANHQRTVHYYDNLNRRVATVDAAGHLAAFEYDAAGNKVTETRYAQKIDISTVSPSGSTPVPVSPDDYRQVMYRYDNHNRLIESRSPETVLFTIDNKFFQEEITTEREYDFAGNLIKVIDANGNKTQFFYDQLGNEILTIDAHGFAAYKEYAQGGNLQTKETQFASAIRSSDMDFLIRRRDVAGILSAYASLPDEQHRAFTYTYDTLGRLTQKTDLKIQYHAVDATTGAIGQRFEFDYSRPIVTYLDGVPVTTYERITEFDLTSTLIRDGMGNIIEMQQPNGESVRFSYDTLGRQQQKQSAVLVDHLGATTRATTNYAYNAFGQAQEITHYGSVQAENRVERIEYDRAGRKVQYWNAIGETTTYKYDLLGNLLRKTEETRDTIFSSAEYIENYYYDDINQKVLTIDAADIKHATQYNGYGEVIGRGRYTGSEVKFYEYSVYDQLGRLFLTNSDKGVAKAYYYDGAGNRTLEAGSGANNIADLYSASSLLYDLARFYRDPSLPEQGSGPQNPGGNPDPIIGPGYPQDPVGPAPGGGTNPGPIIVDPIDPGQGPIDKPVTPVVLYPGLPPHIDLTLLPPIEHFNPGLYRYTIHHYDARNQLAGTFSPPKEFSDIVSGVATPPAASGYFNYYLEYIQRYLAYIDIFGRGSTTSRMLGSGLIYKNYSYNAFGQLEVETNARAHSTRYAYNKLGKLIQKLDPQVDIKDSHYSLLHSDATTSINPETLYYYDELGNRIGSRNARGSYEDSVLLEGGRVIRRFKGASHEYGITDYWYDRLGNLREESRFINGAGERLDFEYSYDRMGNRIHVRRELFRPTPHVVADKPIDFVRRNVTQDGYFYNSRGDRLVHVNGSGKIESYRYDSLSRLTQHISYAGKTTQFAYDFLNDTGGYNKITTIHGGDTLHDKTDYFGRKILHKDLRNRYTDYDYNVAGELSRQHAANSAGAAITGQDIRYQYFDNGWLKQIEDRALNGSTEYDYDAAGNRTHETVVAQDRTGTAVTYQDSRISYDALNRVSRISDPGFNIRYIYDAAGNRAKIISNYQLPDSTEWHNDTFYYTYDRLNRFKSVYVDYDFSERHVTTRKPVKIKEFSYNYLGQRTQSINTYHNGPHWYFGDERIYRVTENYDYNVLGAVEIIDIDGRRIDRYGADNNDPRHYNVLRTYDADGNLRIADERWLNREGTYISTSKHRYRYTNDGQITQDHDVLENKGVNYYYDSRYRLARSQNYNYTDSITMRYSYEAWDTYKERYQRITLDHGSNWIRHDYDINGNRIRVSDNEKNLSTFYVNNHAGKVMERRKLDMDTGATRSYRRFYYANDNGVGDIGSDGIPSQVDYGQRLARAGLGAFNSQAADFDQNLQAVNPQNLGLGAQTYVVQAGDNFQLIAAKLWGNSSLWYLIADANGFSGTESLTAGTRLSIPNTVSNIHNNSETFRPYDPSKGLGHVSPEIPAPPPPSEAAKVSAMVTTIIVAVVAIIVSVVSYGTLSGAAAAGAIGAGTALLGSVAVGAAVAAAANAITQGVMLGLGMQEEFDPWSFLGSTLAGAASGALGSGLGQVGTAAGISGNLLWEAAKGALSSATQEAIASITEEAGRASAGGRGFDFSNVGKSFDWRAVAVGGLGGAVSGFMPSSNIGNIQYDFGTHLLRNVAAGFIKEFIHSSVYKEEMTYKNLISVGTEAFAESTGHAINEHLSEQRELDERRRQTREAERVQREIRALREFHRSRIESNRANAQSQSYTESYIDLEYETPQWMLNRIADGTFSLDAGLQLSLQPMSTPYVVERGDNWVGISQRMYGDPLLFPAIAAESGQSLNRLQPGDLLWAPQAGSFNAERVRQQAGSYYRYRHAVRQRELNRLTSMVSLATQQLSLNPYRIDYESMTGGELIRAMVDHRVAEEAAAPLSVTVTNQPGGGQSVAIIGRPDQRALEGQWVDIGNGLVPVSRDEYIAWNLGQDFNHAATAMTHFTMEALANPYVAGTLQVVGGGMEMLAGFVGAGIPEPMTTAVGIAGVLHGGDTVLAGIDTLISGEVQTTWTQQAFTWAATEAGASEETAEIIGVLGDLGVGIGPEILARIGPALLRQTRHLATHSIGAIRGVGAADNILGLADNVPVLTPDLVIGDDFVMHLDTGAVMHLNDASSPALLPGGSNPLMLPADSAVLPPLTAGSPQARVLITPPPASGSGNVLVTPPPFYWSATAEAEVMRLLDLSNAVEANVTRDMLSRGQVTIISHPSYQSMTPAARQGLHRSAQAFYQPGTNELHLIEANIRNPRRVPGLIGHELTHYNQARAGAPLNSRWAEVEAFEFQEAIDVSLGVGQFRDFNHILEHIDIHPAYRNLPPW